MLPYIIRLEILNALSANPKIGFFLKGLLTIYNNYLQALYKHMTWNRAKYFEVFGWGCSGLGK